jgi:IS30 family transposase
MVLLLLRKEVFVKQKKRLTVDDRINLQACIAKNLSWKETSKILKKNRSTIYRELKNYFTIHDGRRSCVHCVKYDECKENGIVVHQGRNYDCFESAYCSKLSHFPFVCNSCESKKKCNREKRYYDCINAENRSRGNRVGTRKHKRVPKYDIETINEIVSPLIFKGQSIHHIYETNPILKTICCERTIRRLIYDRYLEAKAHDLIRYSRFPHKKKRLVHDDRSLKNIERLFKRTYTDLQRYLKNHPEARVVQFDSVIGKREDKYAILTITFPKERFQFGLRILKSDRESVYSKLHELFSKLGYRKTKAIFPILLADNGIEFNTFHNLEKFDIKVYFTNPYRSTDKAECERNHEFIRYIIPKSKTLDGLTQEDINLMFSHITSYIRESNQNKTPFELVKERFGSEFLELIGIKHVEPNDVVLKPKLLKK